MKTIMDEYFQQLSGGESQQKDNLHREMIIYD